MPLICDSTRESFVSADKSDNANLPPSPSTTHALCAGRVAHPPHTLPMFVRRVQQQLARPSIRPLPLPLPSSSLSRSAISSISPRAALPIHPSIQTIARTTRTMVTATNDAPALAQHDIEQEAHHQSNGTAKVNNWSHPGPAAFDFRSMPDHHPLNPQWPSN